jgi:hypothetical protein
MEYKHAKEFFMIAYSLRDASDKIDRILKEITSSPIKKNEIIQEGTRQSEIKTRRKKHQLPQKD